MAHFASGREFLSLGVTFDYKVDVTFVVDGGDRGVRAANHGFAFFSWLAEKFDMISHGHTYDPFGVRELETDTDGVMRHALNLLDGEFELVVFVLLGKFADSLSPLRICKEC